MEGNGDDGEGGGGDDHGGRDPVHVRVQRRSERALHDVPRGALHDVPRGALRDVPRGALRDVPRGVLRDGRRGDVRPFVFFFKYKSMMLQRLQLTSHAFNCKCHVIFLNFCPRI